MTCSTARQTGVAVVAAIILMSAPAIAQQADVNAMVKWMSAPVVHYKVVGEYTGEVGIMGTGPGPGGVMAKVSDRVEFEFDVDGQMKLLSTPIIRNAPTKSEISYEQRCPSPRIDGTFEFMTVSSLTQQVASTFEFAMTRNFVGGVVSYMGEGKCGVSNFTATSEMSKKVITFVIPMMMAIGEPGKPLPGGEATMTADGKSIVQKRDDGWVWTTTPTIK